MERAEPFQRRHSSSCDSWHVDLRASIRSLARVDRSTQLGTQLAPSAVVVSILSLIRNFTASPTWAPDSLTLPSCSTCDILVVSHTASAPVSPGPLSPHRHNLFPLS
ncbi:hypothetical protein Q8A67_018887 [Cirrhinus molitorella]|uniref:Uncharacterized protein n=1 Tax=Cirrhinus molitorella TaxID=172907 RepID=A0AA88PII7_9TELE|nr:hypothetical protein Q8A67_018887 [Cirrhinus molitorella]